MAKAAVKDSSTGTEQSGDGKAPEKVADPRRKAVRVRAGSLLAALKDVASVIRGGEIPILGHVLFTSGGSDNGHQISLTGTNLDLWATRCLGAEADAEAREGFRSFEITLAAKPLLAVLSEIDADAGLLIELPLDHNPLSATCPRAELSVGRSRFKLPTLPSADFPRPPSFSPVAQFEISASVLGDAFAAVDHAISTEAARYYLNGVYLHLAQETGQSLDLRMASTDGHRLARLTLEAPDGAASFPSVIIAKATVDLLEKLLAAQSRSDVLRQAQDGRPDMKPDLVLIESDGENTGKLRICIGETEIIAKTIDGAFPDYTRVIPSSSPHSAVVERAALMGAIRRVAALASKESRAIKATFRAGQLKLSMNSPENGEAREEMACTFEGDQVSIGFNSKYWLDALAALAGDAVEMGFGDPRAPVTLRPVIEGERFVQVLMPLAI